MAEVTVEKIRGAEDPRINVVFVHGLGGDARRTWLYEKKPRARNWLSRKLFGPAQDAAEAKTFFWPEWLAGRREDCAVYLVDYPADKMGWNAGWPIEDAAVAVLDRLMKNPSLRKSGAPIVFVCHSLGGIVVKQLVLKARAGRDLNVAKGAFLDRVAGVVFLATPHDGSFLATLASAFGWAVTDTMRDLIANSAKLGNLSDDYRDYIASNDGRIRHLIYFEKEGVAGVKVVSTGSANPGLAGAERVPIGRDHIQICKAPGESDQVVEGVLAFLEEVLGSRPPTPGETLGAVKDDTTAIRENVERLTAELSLSNTQKDSLAVDLAKVKAEYGGTVDLISGFLETMIGRRIAPEQFATTLFKIAADWKTAGEKIDALTFSSNLSPRLSVLRDEAKAAHASGMLDLAEQRLAQIAQEEIDALSRLEEHEREVLSEIRLRKKGVAQTKAAQAAVAHARLNYREAANLYREAAALVADFDPEARVECLFAQAGELNDLGNEFGVNDALLGAIALLRQCLLLSPRERAPLIWATAQNNLGLALARLGERESNTANLDSAIIAYHAALEECRRDKAPLDWAMIQNNLGLALMRLGERETGVSRLEQAVEAFNSALQEWTRERVPLSWAMAQVNLGLTLLRLGERAIGTKGLEESVAALRNALEEIHREIEPLKWSTTLNNLGIALQRLGEREIGTDRLEEAVTAYRSALQERTRERAPLDWAMTQNNLGLALQTIGDRENGVGRLIEAVAAYRSALEEFTEQRVPLLWATTQHNLGSTLMLLGGRENSPARLQEAVAAYRAALKERKREIVPLDWAMSQDGLAVALTTLSTRESSRDAAIRDLEEAVAVNDAALEMRTRERVPVEWARSSCNQGVTLLHLADLTGDAAMAEKASRQIEMAHEAMRNGVHAPIAAFCETWMQEARALVERLKGP